MFYIFYNLKINYVIECQELDINSETLVFHSIFRIFIEIPKSIAFFYFYKILKFYKNGSTNIGFVFIFNILILLILIYTINIVLILFLG